MAKKQRVSVVNGVLTVEYPTIGKVFKADLSKYPETVYRPCLAADHGMKQKFGDAESGKSPAEKYEMVQRIHDNLMNGEWELTASIDMTPLILEAVRRLEKVPQAKLEAIVKRAPEKVKEWGSNVKVKAEIAKMRAEKAAKAAAEATDEIDLEIE